MYLPKFKLGRHFESELLAVFGKMEVWEVGQRQSTGERGQVLSSSPGKDCPEV